jgi:uncharacterized protein YpmS
MKKPIIFYFHESDNDTATVLKEHFPDTYVFHIDSDTTMTQLEEAINSTLLDYLNEQNTLVVFVGASQGEHYANVLGLSYGAQTLLENFPTDLVTDIKELL